MKHVKILGLLVMAAASLMAFASSASATAVLTSPAGTEYTGEIHATLEPNAAGSKTALLKAGIEDTCTESTVLAKVEVNNEKHAEGPITAGGLTFGNCTNDTTVINPGRLTISDTGTVFTIESRVEVKVTSLGISCFYGAEAEPISIGDLITGTPATIAVNTTKLKRLAGSNTFFCAAEATWTGSYKVTEPPKNGTLLLT